MNRLDKFISYIYPIIIEYTSSNRNSVLEVVYKDGKYQLNSANANYSYGGLYDLFNLVFKEIPFDWSNLNDVLILGFGAGCTVPLLRAKNTSCRIVGIEADSKVLELGEKYFKTNDFNDVQIVCETAANYAKVTNRRFDLVIIDVYIDTDVPSEVETKEFLGDLKAILNPNGVVVFNKLVPNRSYQSQIPELKSLYEQVFGSVEIYSFMETGRVFVARKQQ